MTCEVCCEDFNSSSRKKVKCPYCPFNVCTGCSERYLCDTTSDAHCMGCRKGWSREILVNNFTQKFMTKTYKSRRENLLLEREKSLMPATQPYVELEKNIRQLTTKIEEVRNLITLATMKQTAFSARPVPLIMSEYNLQNEIEAQILRHKLSTEQSKIRLALLSDQGHIEYQINVMTNLFHNGIIDREKRKFVRACPYENCKGFLSTAWKCGMCENWTCPECHEGKGQDKTAPHTCNPDSIATAKLLAADSRNCPKCASMIFKIDGCDQMYCTQCHTAFSWRTGLIETGRVHNPHYYEYQRAHGGLAREPGDVPCGGYPHWETVMRLVQMNNEFRRLIINAYRGRDHVSYTVLPRYTVDLAMDNRDLRIKLMIGDIDEDDFKKKIQQREKARQRKTEIHQVLEMYMAVTNDIFQSFVQTKNIPDLINSLHELKSHVTETLADVSKRYTKCAVPKMNEMYEWMN